MITRSRQLRHRVLSTTTPGQARVWCRQHFGAAWDPLEHRDGTWCVRWDGKFRSIGPQYIWRFAREQDAVLFSLRWT